MARLTDYLDIKTLQQLQDAFSVVGRLPIRLCDADGKPLVKPSPISLSADDGQSLGSAMREIKPQRRADGLALSHLCDVPILVQEDVVGKIIIDCQPTAGPKVRVARPQSDDASIRILRYVGLMANVVSRMCDRENILRSRVEQLAALYHLTAEFTSRRDLQNLLNLVAATVVKVLRVKACSIRLLSEDHRELVMKAVANLSPEYLDKGPILVSQSQIDKEVLSTLKAVYIPDERTDQRVLYSEQARREGIVSAICAPLTYKGHAEGVIHVYSGRKYKFDWFEASLLEAMAGEAAAAIVNARLYAEAVGSANMKRQISLAGEVQRRMIPSEAPAVPGMQIGSKYISSYELGGDFYDFLRLPPNNMGIAVCDVVGKGVRASLLMASIRASLRAHAAGIYDMSEVVARVSRDLCEDTLTSDFATLFYAVLDYSNRQFTYVNAGHPPALLFRDGQVTSLAKGGTVLGIDPASRWRQDSFFLNGGDVVLIYTDGLSEAMNFEDESFGKARIELAGQAAIAQGLSADGIVKHIIWEMRRFAGLQTRFDDLTLVAIKVL